MKTKVLSFTLIFISTAIYGQARLEKGYFIDTNNHKTECFIRNYDWQNNPREFEYTIENNDSIKKNTITFVREFGIYGYSKYVRADVNIDRSSIDLKTLSTQKSPVWSQEQLFLKVLIDGKATLYSYSDGGLPHFFYSKADRPTQQLVCKDYIDKEGKLNTNASFRQQLWNDIKCANTSTNILEKIGYYQKDLENYFNNYNKCSGDTTVVNYSYLQNRDLFNLRINQGLNYTSLIFKDTYSTSQIKYNSTITFRVGIEAEYILPFNQNKWGILIEPTFQYYNTKKGIPTYRLPVTINLNLIEFPIGIRYYYLLNEKMKIYLNAFYIPNYTINFNRSINFNHLNALELKPNQSYAVGGGIDYKNLSLELRYYTSKDLLSTYVFYSTDYNRFEVIAGYRFLRIKEKKSF